MFSRILVGVDGETGGRDALPQIRTLASPSTELVLAHVWRRSDGVHGVTKEAACAVLVVPRGAHLPAERSSAATGAEA